MPLAAKNIGISYVSVIVRREVAVGSVVKKSISIGVRSCFSIGTSLSFTPLAAPVATIVTIVVGIITTIMTVKQVARISFSYSISVGLSLGIRIGCSFCLCKQNNRKNNQKLHSDSDSRSGVTVQDYSSIFIPPLHLRALVCLL